MTLFRADLKHLLTELATARRSELSDIRKIFDNLFGEQVSERAVQSYVDGLPAVAVPGAYERGKGFVAAPALLSPMAAKAAEVSRAPAHHFHPGRLAQ